MRSSIAAVVGITLALSTAAMVLYPVLCTHFGFSPETSGVLLGATIHDVAQVAGASYAVSETVGNTAIVVKLFRVFLLLPVVIFIGWYFLRRQPAGRALPVPRFAFAFLALAIANSVVTATVSIGPVYAALKMLLAEASSWGLLVAISAIGLQTSFRGIATVGWRNLLVVVSTTIVILAAVFAGLFLSTKWLG